MAVPNEENIKAIKTPGWFGAQRYTYSNYSLASTDVIASDFFADTRFNFAARDLMWCKLSAGYFTLRFTSSTTAEIATD